MADGAPRNMRFDPLTGNWVFTGVEEAVDGTVPDGDPNDILGQDGDLSDPAFGGDASAGDTDTGDGSTGTGPTTPPTTFFDPKSDLTDAVSLDLKQRLESGDIGYRSTFEYTDPETGEKSTKSVFDYLAESANKQIDEAVNKRQRDAEILASDAGILRGGALLAEYGQSVQDANEVFREYLNELSVDEVKRFTEAETLFYDRLSDQQKIELDAKKLGLDAADLWNDIDLRTKELGLKDKWETARLTLDGAKLGLAKEELDELIRSNKAKEALERGEIQGFFEELAYDADGNILYQDGEPVTRVTPTLDALKAAGLTIGEDGNVVDSLESVIENRRLDLDEAKLTGELYVEDPNNPGTYILTETLEKELQEYDIAISIARETGLFDDPSTEVEEQIETLDRIKMFGKTAEGQEILDRIELFGFEGATAGDVTVDKYRADLEDRRLTNEERRERDEMWVNALSEILGPLGLSSMVTDLLRELLGGEGPDGLPPPPSGGGGDPIGNPFDPINNPTGLYDFGNTGPNNQPNPFNGLNFGEDFVEVDWTDTSKWRTFGGNNYYELTVAGGQPLPTADGRPMYMRVSDDGKTIDVRSGDLDAIEAGDYSSSRLEERVIKKSDGTTYTITQDSFFKGVTNGAFMRMGFDILMNGGFDINTIGKLPQYFEDALVHQTALLAAGGNPLTAFAIEYGVSEVTDYLDGVGAPDWSKDMLSFLQSDSPNLEEVDVSRLIDWHDGGAIGLGGGTQNVWTPQGESTWQNHTQLSPWTSAIDAEILRRAVVEWDNRNMDPTTLQVFAKELADQTGWNEKNTWAHFSRLFLKHDGDFDAIVGELEDMELDIDKDALLAKRVDQQDANVIAQGSAENGKYNFNDFLKFIGHWNTSEGESGYDEMWDLNNDGKIDALDYNRLATTFDGAIPTMSEAGLNTETTSDDIVVGDMTGFDTTGDFQTGTGVEGGVIGQEQPDQTAEGFGADTQFDGATTEQAAKSTTSEPAPLTYSPTSEPYKNTVTGLEGVLRDAALASDDIVEAISLIKRDGSLMKLLEENDGNVTATVKALYELLERRGIL